MQVWGLVPLLVGYIVEGKIDNELRLTAALDFLLKMKPGAVMEDVSKPDLEAAAGVGVEVTPEQVEAAVEEALGAVKEEVVAARYRYNTGPLMAAVRTKLKWADGKAVKAEFDLQLLDILGPKTDADLAPPPKTDKKKGDKKAPIKKDKDESKTETANADVEDGAATIAELMKTKVHFHLPGENHTTDG